jgi:7-carboxy-7-deazaguanine synthase
MPTKPGGAVWKTLQARGHGRASEPRSPMPFACSLDGVGFPNRPESARLRLMPETLVVNEIYLSLQGESSFAGLPCVFVRLTGCNLRCSYCDTAYAFSEGRRRSIRDVVDEVGRLARGFTETPARRVQGAAPPEMPHWPVVELTGGEPLLQPGSLPLMRALCDGGRTVLLETSGALDIGPVDERVRRIMDLKCPSSGEVERNRWANIERLRNTDEIKFVIGTREDYEWARQTIAARQLAGICPLLVSWVHPLTRAQQVSSLKPVPGGQTAISRRELAERILADFLPVRFQVQLHKVIWAADERGV